MFYFMLFILIELLQLFLSTSYQCCSDLQCIKKKTCETHNCYVAIKVQENFTLSRVINISQHEYVYFDCWQWEHEYKFCPKNAGECKYAYGMGKKSFCCAGNLCNFPVNLSCTYEVNATERYTGKSTTPFIPKQNSDINVTLIFTAIFVLILILFIALVIIIVIARKSPQNRYVNLRKLFHGKRRHNVSSSNYNGVGYKSDMNTFMASGDFQDKLSNNLIPPSALELSQGSKYYDKNEKKCVGKFGEIWIGKLLDSVEANDDTEFSRFVADKKLPNHVAIKIFKPNNEPSWEVELEIYRYTRNRCSRVLQYIGWDKVTDHQQVLELWLLTEYLERGSLHDCLRRESESSIISSNNGTSTSNSTSRRPTWCQMLTTCIDIAGGLSYLHEDGTFHYSGAAAGKPSIAHRDLKSRNVLIRHNWNACIADMGLAVSFHGNRSVSELHLQVGTHRYMAPEVLEGAISFSRDAFLAIDIYAMALVMWEIFSQVDDLGPDYQQQQQLHNVRLDSGGIQCEPYRQPFEKELGSQITIERLQDWIVNENNRPQFPAQYEGFEYGVSMWKMIAECWDRDAEARLSSSCVYERLLDLQARSCKNNSNSNKDATVTMDNVNETVSYSTSVCTQDKNHQEDEELCPSLV